MHDEWAERLSAYIDGDFSAEDRVLLEAHLETCPSCPALLVELRQVIAGARALPDLAPPTDLWPGIEERITAFAHDARPAAGHRARRGIVASWPQLAAAGFALVLLSGGGAWYAARMAGSARPAVVAPTATPASHARALDRELTGELEQLELVLAEKRGELDPETVQTIEHNLRIIDQAATQAREALAADPANPFLRDYLSKTMKRKITMLKEATMLASAQ